MDGRSEVASIMGALAVHVDARRWRELEALFAPELQVDYTALFGGAPQQLNREGLIAQWRGLLPGFTRTCHLIGTPLVAVTGATASAAASVVATHWISEPSPPGGDKWIAGGCYELSLIRLDGAWRIATTDTGMRLAGRRSPASERSWAMTPRTCTQAFTRSGAIASGPLYARHVHADAVWLRKVALIGTNLQAFTARWSLGRSCTRHPARVSLPRKSTRCRYSRYTRPQG